MSTQTRPVDRWLAQGGRAHRLVTCDPALSSGSISVSRGGSISVSAKASVAPVAQRIGKWRLWPLDVLLCETNAVLWNSSATIVTAARMLLRFWLRTTPALRNAREIMNTTRPKLTLKKPVPTPTINEAPKPAPKPKHPDQGEKEQLRLENIRRQEELRALRKPRLEKVKLFVSDYLANKSVITEVVVINSVECFRPLAIRTRQAIASVIRGQPEFQDCSNTLISEAISDVLSLHVAKEEYQNGLFQFNERFDLDGAVQGKVTDGQKKKAALRRGNQSIEQG